MQIIIAARFGSYFSLSVLAASTLAVFPTSPAISSPEEVMYSFLGGTNDGANPYANLIEFKGNLYGTTELGGKSKCGVAFVYNTTSLTETVFNNFDGTDGCNPLAPLTADTTGNGSFYGTGETGGTNNDGTVFVLPASGHSKALYNFSETGGEGLNPTSGVAEDKDGNLFGVTPVGTEYGGGGVYEVLTTGKTKVLHTFTNGTDGYIGQGDLVEPMDDVFFGITLVGGNPNCAGENHGCGAIYTVANGSYSRVSAIPKLKDGLGSTTALVEDGMGNLYGTSTEGGTYGVGTVFEYTSEGKWKVLHDFQKGGADGYNSNGPLAFDLKGNLWGTTSNGGADNGGIVFEITEPATKAQYAVVYSFTGTNGTGDGAGPFAGLVMDKNGNLWGTTAAYGLYGYGTIFRIKN